MAPGDRVWVPDPGGRWAGVVLFELADGRVQVASLADPARIVNIDPSKLTRRW